MSRINRPNDNVDENPNEFDQINSNVREGYNSLSKDIKFKKVKCKYTVHKINVDEELLSGRNEDYTK